MSPVVNPVILSYVPMARSLPLLLRACIIRDNYLHKTSPGYPGTGCEIFEVVVWPGRSVLTVVLSVGGVLSEGRSSQRRIYVWSTGMLL